MSPPPDGFEKKLGDALGHKEPVHKYQDVDPSPSRDSALNQLIEDVRASRAQRDPEATHTAIGAAHDGMFDNLIKRAFELTSRLSSVRPDASSPGIDAMMEHVAAIGKSIDEAAHAIDVSKHAALDYNAAVASYWANITPVREEAKQLQSESDKANQLIALRVVKVGDDGEQLVPNLFSTTPFAIQQAVRIMDGQTVRVPERVQESLQANADLQRQIAETFRNSQPSIQAALGPEVSMINPPPPIPLSPSAVIPESPGQSDAGPLAAPMVLPGGRRQSPRATPSVAAPQTATPDAARATTPSVPRLDNATLLGAQSQNSVPTVMMPPGYQAAQQLPGYSAPSTGGTAVPSASGPRAMSDSEFSKLLDSAGKKPGPTGLTTSGAALPNLSTSGTSTSAASPGASPLVQPPSWANAQTAATNESAGANGRQGSGSSVQGGVASSRPTSGMPMMPMMPPGQGGGAGKADKSDRPPILSVDPMVYGDDIKSTDPVIRPRKTEG